MVRSATHMPVREPFHYPPPSTGRSRRTRSSVEIIKKKEEFVAEMAMKLKWHAPCSMEEADRQFPRPAAKVVGHILSYPAVHPGEARKCFPPTYHSRGPQNRESTQARPS